MEEIQYYDHYEQALTQSQKKKVDTLVERGLIKYNKDGKCFVCEPIPGYNTRTYQMTKRLNGRFDCNCQFMAVQRKKLENNEIGEDEMRHCSHIAALIVMFKNKRFGHA